MRTSEIDYMLFGKAIEVVEMVVEDLGKLDVGSDHNLIWSKVIWGWREVRRRAQYKWRVDCKLDWEEYQEAVEEVLIGWGEEVRELEQELEGGILECGVDGRRRSSCSGGRNW